MLRSNMQPDPTYTVHFSTNYSVWFACRQVGQYQGEFKTLGAAQEAAVRLNKIQDERMLRLAPGAKVGGL